MAQNQPPAWPKAYSVQGALFIPFAEIHEPFQAYIDTDNGNSRIDYYDGMDKTYQLKNQGSYGLMLKIVPMTDEKVFNQMNCFAVNGSQDSPIDVQPILPDLSGFELKGNEKIHDCDCQKWQKEEEIGHKLNKYTIWLKVENDVAIPKHYEMKGFNTLLGSHYDHYFLKYMNFDPTKPDPKIFSDYNATSCHDWPGPGYDHTYTMNPMKEFIDNEKQHIHQAFDHFEKRHEKKYRDVEDRENRKDIFMQNMRFITSKNRNHLSYTLASNHLTDFTDSERARLRGRLTSTGYNGGQQFSYSTYELNSTPRSLDWRLYGAVTPVKDQASCGSCWSFGTVGTLEGTHFLQTGNLVRFSQQALVDCSWGFGNNGCDGGEDFRVYQFMMKHGGIPTENSYGPYLGNDGFCHMNASNVEIGFQIRGFVNVTSGDLRAAKVAVAKHGPLSVGIDASHKSLSFYSSGVYYEPKCGNTLEDLDHAVLLVGYGKLNGQHYWLIKNSWSTYWGNDGYVLMSQKDNNCGVATQPTFVIPK